MGYLHTKSGISASPKQDISAQYICSIFPFLSVVYTQGESTVKPATSLYAEISEFVKEALVGPAKLVKYKDGDVDATVGALPKRYSRLHRNVGAKM